MLFIIMYSYSEMYENRWVWMKNNVAVVVLCLLELSKQYAFLALYRLATVHSHHHGLGACAKKYDSDHTRKIISCIWSMVTEVFHFKCMRWTTSFVLLWGNLKLQFVYRDRITVILRCYYHTIILEQFSNLTESVLNTLLLMRMKLYILHDLC